MSIDNVKDSVLYSGKSGFMTELGQLLLSYPVRANMEGKVEFRLW